jgi:hypothetical protein
MEKLGAEVLDNEAKNFIELTIKKPYLSIQS